MRGARVKSRKSNEQFGGGNATNTSELIETRADGEQKSRGHGDEHNGIERGAMSKATLDAIHAAVQAHFDDIGETGHVAAWVISVELQDVDEDATVTYRNNYATSESSPNTTASLAAWTSAAINEDAFGDYYEAQ